MSKILSSLLIDLAEYTGDTMAEIQSRMDNCRHENAEEWLALNPETFVDANEFYSMDESAIYQSTAWLLRDQPMREIIMSIPESAEKFEWETVFDYGTGIGTPSLVLAELNNRVKIAAADFDCPAMSFAKWKAQVHQLDIEFENFCTCLEVPTIGQPRDCVLCIHVIGHSLNPLRTLAEVATHGKYTVWLNDFRVHELTPDDMYPMHQKKPAGWDKIWNEIYEPVGNHVQRSKVFGLDADKLALEWLCC